MRVQAYAPRTRILLGLMLLISVTALTLLVPYGWLLPLLTILLGLILRPWSAYQHSQPVSVASPEPTAWDMQTTRVHNPVLLSDGSEQDGLLVPLQQQQEWKLILTRNGYVLVDQQNQLRYKLRS